VSEPFLCTWACEPHLRSKATLAALFDCEECMRRLHVVWEKDQEKILALSAEVKRLGDKLFAARFPGRSVRDLSREELASFYRDLVPGPARVPSYGGDGTFHVSVEVPEGDHAGYEAEEDFGFQTVPLPNNARLPIGALQALELGIGPRLKEDA
jgi:hypothetical protein